MSQARPKWHFYAYLLNLIANKTALNTHINNTEIKLLQRLNYFFILLQQVNRYIANIYVPIRPNYLHTNVLCMRRR